MGAVGLQTAVRAVLPGMRERGAGTVLVTGGGSADHPVTSMATLGVQKAAVRALAQVQAHALAPAGVHVATVTVRGLSVGPADPSRAASRTSTPSWSPRPPARARAGGPSSISIRE